MRLTADIWVSAYLARLRLIAIPAFVVQRGDATAGAVLIKLNTLDGRARCYQRSFDPTTGDRKWMILHAGDEAEVDASITKQRGFDTDLWVIEVEDKQGRHLLDEPVGMIEWRDEGALLCTRPFGESAVIIEVFSATHGRHSGVVRGGTSRKVAPTLQPGAQR